MTAKTPAERHEPYVTAAGGRRTVLCSCGWTRTGRYPDVAWAAHVGDEARRQAAAAAGTVGNSQG